MMNNFDKTIPATLRTKTIADLIRTHNLKCQAVKILAEEGRISEAKLQEYQAALVVEEISRRGSAWSSVL